MLQSMVTKDVRCTECAVTFIPRGVSSQAFKVMACINQTSQEPYREKTNNYEVTQSRHNCLSVAQKQHDAYFLEHRDSLMKRVAPRLPPHPPQKVYMQMYFHDTDRWKDSTPHTSPLNKTLCAEVAAVVLITSGGMAVALAICTGLGLSVRVFTPTVAQETQGSHLMKQ